MPVPTYTNPQAYQQGINDSEQTTADRLRDSYNQGSDIEQSRTLAAAQGVDQAIRQSYAATQPTAPSADPSGAPNITSGQTQVQTVPMQSDTTPAPQAPTVPAIPASALATQYPMASARSVTPPPAPGADAMSPSAQGRATPQQMAQAAASTAAAGTQAPVPPPSPAQPSSQRATPFDSPDFMNNLAGHLAQVPGAGAELMKIKGSRDTMIGDIMTQIGNGNPDVAKFMADRNGINIPQQFYQNGDMARAMALAQKAYPDEPDKGQAFYQAMMQNPGGDLEARVQQGMQVAGVPTNKDQRELSKALALAKYQQNAPKPYIGPGGSLMEVDPATNTATPVTMAGDTKPVSVTAGYGLKTGRMQSRFMNVGGQLVDTQSLDSNGRPSVVVPKNADPTTAITSLTRTIMTSGQRMKPEEAAAEAQKIFASLKSGGQPQSIGTQVPNMPTATMPTRGAPVVVTGPAQPATAVGDTPSQVPAQLMGKNLQFSPSRNQYRDVDTGQVYDVNGNQVQ